MWLVSIPTGLFTGLKEVERGLKIHAGFSFSGLPQSVEYTSNGHLKVV